MAREGWSSTLLRKDLHPQGQSAQAQHRQISPQLSGSWTLKTMEDNRTHLCNFWWLRMGCYMADYVKGCDLFNHMKTFPASPTSELMPNQFSDHLWQVISVDLITELPPSQGYDA